MNAYEQRIFDTRGWVVVGDSGCLSGDPYCGNAPPPYGSYEAYAGELCGDCDERERENRIAANTIPAGPEGDEWE